MAGVRPPSVLIKKPAAPAALSAGVGQGKQAMASELARAKQGAGRLKTQAKVPVAKVQAPAAQALSGPAAANAQKAVSKARASGALSEHPVRSVLVRGASARMAGKTPQISQAGQSAASLRFKQAERLDAAKAAAKAQVAGKLNKVAAPVKPGLVKGGQAVKSVLVKDRSGLRSQLGRAKQAAQASQAGQAAQSAGRVAKKLAPGAREAAHIADVARKVL
jgi:hypothetical protein